jgi:hypothetical protein
MHGVAYIALIQLLSNVCWLYVENKIIRYSWVHATHARQTIQAPPNLGIREASISVVFLHQLTVESIKIFHTPLRSNPSDTPRRKFSMRSVPSRLQRTRGREI